MTRSRVLRSTIRWQVLTALVALAALPASAQNLRAGLDLFTSQQGSAVDFSNNPLPSGFFPGCGLGYNGSISLTGAPIAASQNLGKTDTIVSRLNSTVFNASGQGTAQLRITALCLKNNAWTDPCGQTWKVAVRLASAAQPIGGMAILRTSAQGGTFGSSFSVLGEVSFTDGFTNLGPVADSILLKTTSACWSYTPGTPSVTVTGPVTVDTDCDGTPETALPGTSNFHAGWCPGPSGPPTWTPVTHDGPHPVGPAGPCKTTTHDADADTAMVEPAPGPVQAICAEALPVEPKVIIDHHHQ
jgi:hypothetical protein